MDERDLIRSWMAWKEELDGRCFSQKDLSERAGISPTYLSSILTGTRNAGTKTIDRLAGAFGISRAVFYAGPADYRGGTSSVPEAVPQSPVFVPPEVNEEPLRPSPESVGESPVSVAHTGWNLSWTASREVERLLGADDGRCTASQPLGRNTEQNSATSGIPILDSEPDGGWNAWQPETGGGYPALSRTLLGGPRIFAVRVEDDSMVPVLQRGSIVVADADAVFADRPGRIAVVPGKDGLLVRLVARTEDGDLFFPANPAYDSELAGTGDAALFPAVCIIPPGVETE